MRYACQYCDVKHQMYEDGALPCNSCLRCWIKFFSRNLKQTDAARAALEMFGREAAVRTKGEKYVRFVERYYADLGVKINYAQALATD